MRRLLLNNHKLVAIFVGQRPHEHSVDHAENCSVRTDAQRQG